MVYILDKSSLTRTRFAFITSNELTLDLGHMARNIFNTSDATSRVMLEMIHPPML